MNFLSKPMLALAIFVSSFIASGQPAQPVYLFKGGVNAKLEKESTSKELAPVPARGKFLSQVWTFIYYTDDGAGGYIQFSQARLGYIFKQAIVQHSHYTPEGKVVYRKKVLTGAEANWEEKEPRLAMGEFNWSGFYPQFRVFVPLEGLEAELTFHCLTAPWRPGQGPAHYGSPQGDWYDLLVMIPLGRVSGEMKIGGKRKQISGFGYADHSTQTIWFPRQCEELYALRSFNQRWAINFLDYHSPPAFGNQRVSWLMVIKDGKIIYATDNYDLEPYDWKAESGSGRKYPRKARLAINDQGFKLEGEIKASRLLDFMDMRDQVPKWLQSTLNRLIRQPAFIRQKAEASWKISYDGREELVSGRGIFEYAVVGK